MCYSDSKYSTRTLVLGARKLKYSEVHGTRMKVMDYDTALDPSPPPSATLGMLAWHRTSLDLMTCYPTCGRQLGCKKKKNVYRHQKCLDIRFVGQWHSTYTTLSSLATMNTTWQSRVSQTLPLQWYQAYIRNIEQVQQTKQISNR